MLVRLLSQRALFSFLGVAFLVMVPMISTVGFFIHVATLILLWAMICLSLNVIFGYAGQLSLAHGGLFGTGAYVYGVLTTKLGMSFWVALPLGGIAAGIIGLLIGVPCLRLRGPYFVIITLAFNVIIVAIIENLTSLTGGVVGLMGIPGAPDIPLHFFTIEFSSRSSQYYLVLFFLLIFWFVMYLLRNSLLGRSLVAIKEDEDLCQSLGINTMWAKSQAFVLSSILAGLGGALYASYIRIITPHDASFHIGFDALVFLTVGGIGTIFGTIIGPAIMVVISELLQPFLEVHMLINGLALLLLIIFLPQGVAGILPILWKKTILFLEKKWGKYSRQYNDTRN